MASNNKEYGIVANFHTINRFWRRGALAYLLRWDGDAENPVVLSLTKSGRRVEGRTGFKRLTNYRAKWVPLHIREKMDYSFTKEEAQVFADKMSVWDDIRVFDHKGKLQRDGVSISERLL